MNPREDIKNSSKGTVTQLLRADSIIVHVLDPLLSISNDDGLSGNFCCPEKGMYLIRNKNK